MAEPHGAGNDIRRKPVAGVGGCFLHTQSLRDTCSTCQNPGEHGVGKKHCMHASPTYRLMATIKRAVDPDNIMNLRKAVRLN